MKVLIIGGLGYIGSRVTEYLEQQKIEVHIVDAGWFVPFPKEYPTIKIQLMADISTEYIQQFDAVILLAAHSSVGMCVGVADTAIQNNVLDPIKLVKKLLPHQLFIYSSSSSVYGDTSDLVVDEWHKLDHPYTEYDLTKSTFDSFMRMQTYHTNWVGLRYATVCGGAPHIRTDLMINMMYHTAKTTEKIYLFGGAVNRSILSVLDLAKSIYWILKDPKTPNIFNLASLHSTNFSIAEEVSDILKVSIEYKKPEGISKTTSSRYNYKVDCSHFESCYHPIGGNLRKRTAVRDIVEELDVFYETALKTSREIPKDTICLIGV